MVYSSPMKIGELSKKTDVSIDTVRYYEQRGLIPQATRTLSGYRQYSGNDITRLNFIVQEKELGFTLEEIGQLLAISSDGQTCSQVKTVAQAKAEEIEARIHKLTHMRQTLLNLAEQCEKTGGVNPCPILNVLEKI